MTKIGFQAASMYADGKDVLDVAADMIAMLVEVAPDSPAVTGRRAVAGLLNADWSPPSEADRAEAVAKVRADLEWLEAHAHLPCGCGHAIARHVAAPGSRCTDCAGCWAWIPDGEVAS